MITIITTITTSTIKKVKKVASLIIAATVILCFSCFTAFASSEKTTEKTPVYAESLVSGKYEIEVTSSSSMFRIVSCELVVSGSEMTAEMTLSGKGYEKLFMGTSEQAEAADQSKYYFFHETADGKYAYTVPVEALDKDIDCAAYSFKKQRWYDRILVFESESLPDTAFSASETIGSETEVNSGSSVGFSVILCFIIAGIICATGIAAAVVVIIKKK